MPALRLLAAALLMCGCTRSERTQSEPTATQRPDGPETGPSLTPPATRKAACPADQLPALRLADSRRPGCAQNESMCRQACLEGDASSCYERALQLQLGNSESESEIALLFLRACELGHASGCTNYAAYLWGQSWEATVQTCARRLFEATCAAKDSYGCGMLGRILVDGGRPEEIERGRRVLESSCDELRGFACRALALELESGKLGAYERSRIKSLIDRACAGGDPDACGGPATASETFR